LIHWAFRPFEPRAWRIAEHDFIVGMVGLDATARGGSDEPRKVGEFGMCRLPGICLLSPLLTGCHQKKAPTPPPKPAVSVQPAMTGVQNIQAALGRIGATPTEERQHLQLTIKTEGRPTKTDEKSSRAAAFADNRRSSPRRCPFLKGSRCPLFS
jgi:hypothetical protein